MSPQDNDADVHAGNIHSRLDTTPRRVSVNDISAPTKSDVVDSIGSEPEASTPESEPTVTPDTAAADQAAFDQSASEPAWRPVAADQPVAPVVAAKAAPAPQSKGKYAHYALDVVLIIAVVALALMSWSLSSDKKNLKSQVASLNANPQAVIQKQSDDLITKVGALIKLPTGETPTIALVSDAAAAKQQSAFFANAEDGDKVLMYVKAGEAILYRPSTDKVILVAPLTFNNATATTTTTKK